MTPLVAALLAFFVAAASPGPATLAQAQVAMAHGRPAALRFGAGLALGLGVWGVLAAVGVGALLMQSAAALSVLKVLGGAYLLWLAVKSARSAARAMTDPSRDARTRAGFQAGLILNLSNPKAVLAWIAVLAISAPGADAQLELAVTALAATVLGWAIYAAYGVIFSIGPARKFYGRARRAIEAGAAILFAGLGLRLIFGRLAH